jgi:hypothetical protein
MTHGKRISVLCLTAAAIVAAARPAEAARVWIAGDSMMKLVVRPLNRELAAIPGTEVLPEEVSIGTGLARLDVHDWMVKAREAAAKKPEVVVLFMGPNDNQPMRLDNGSIVQFGTTEWSAEYRRRVGAFLDLLRAGGMKHALWISLPDMRDAKLQADTRAINAAVKAALDGRADTEYFDCIPLLSPKPGTYSAYVFRKDTGMPLHVRAGDGTHLNRDGADLLAKEIVARLRPHLSR